MRFTPFCVLFLSISFSAYAGSISTKYTGNWLLINGVVVLQLAEDGTMTLRNTGVSAKVELSEDGTFRWNLPEEQTTTGRIKGDTLYLKNTQPNAPAWIEFLEFRRAEEKAANAVIEIALQQQTAALASFAKIRESSIRMAVLNNLRQLAAAADQYYLENGTTETTYEQLVGPDKMIAKLNPIDGESYEGIKFALDAGEWKIVTASGLIVTYAR